MVKMAYRWGGALLGSFTAEMLDDQEGILSVERFDVMLTSIECNRKGLVLTFEDDASFAHAQRVRTGLTARITTHFSWLLARAIAATTLQGRHTSFLRLHMTRKQTLLD